MNLMAYFTDTVPCRDNHNQMYVSDSSQYTVVDPCCGSGSVAIAGWFFLMFILFL